MKITIIALSVLLLATNVFWLYLTIDNGVTATYREQEFYEEQKTRVQLSKLLPEVSQALSKQQLVAIAEKQYGEESYDKDGCTWVGWLGFKFNLSGKLVFVSPSWSSSEKDPCYPVHE